MQPERLRAKLRLSVIVPTFRRFGPLLDTVQALLVQQDADFEILAVDQNPTWPDALQDRKAELANDARVTWLVRDQPGVVAARHDAVAAAAGDIFVFIDDDVLIPDRFFLARHLANYEAFPDLDVVVGRAVYREQALPPVAAFPPPRSSFTMGEPVSGTPCSHFDRMRPSRYEVVSFCTCNSSVRRE